MLPTTSCSRSTLCQPITGELRALVRAAAYEMSRTLAPAWRDATQWLTVVNWYMATERYQCYHVLPVEAGWGAGCKCLI